MNHSSLRFQYLIIGVFDPNKALELPNLSSIKHSINTDSIVPYRPLYNLLET